MSLWMVVTPSPVLTDLSDQPSWSKYTMRSCDLLSASIPSESTLPASHSWQSLPKFSGRRISQWCWRSGYFSHSLVSLSLSAVYIDHHHHLILCPLTVRATGAPQTISQPVSSIVLCYPLPLGLGELQACPFSDVVFPLLLSALSSSPFHCAFQGCFGQTWWTGDMSIHCSS